MVTHYPKKRYAGYEMPGESVKIYWDANVFLSYVAGVPDRLETLDRLLELVARDERELLTSTLTITEVAYVRTELPGGSLELEEVARIDELWTPPSKVKLVELTYSIARDARELIRQANQRGWTLKPPDAVHLATAGNLKVDVMHSYDGGLPRGANVLGFSILPPSVDQPRLPGI